MANTDREPQSLDDLAAEADTIEAEAAARDAAPESGSDDAAPDALAIVTAERDEMRDRFMRALADAENTRKRADRDRREAENYGGSRLARDLLPVYDNLRRALDSIAEDQRDAQKALIDGIDLTMRELLNVFSKHGVQRIAPEPGEKFDPQTHQAMFEAPVPGTKAGEIIQVMTEGFWLHDRLLRPAQVGVSSTPAS